MSRRLLLYAEGPAEDRGENVWLPEPGEPLDEEMLGPAHALVRRAVADLGNLPPAAVTFLSPLRHKGRPHRGSDLLVKKILRELLTVANPKRRPDLAIVMVDEDGKDGRRSELLSFTEGLLLPRVIAVAVREFEAWLMADGRVLADVLGRTATPPDPEGMKPGEAKSQLRSWIQAAADQGPDRHGDSIRALRLQLAQSVRLEALTRSRSFRQFQTDLSDGLGT